jgi:hypothetical protein
LKAEHGGTKRSRRASGWAAAVMLKVQGGAVHGWRLRSAASAILDAERLRLSGRRGWWQHMY